MSTDQSLVALVIGRACWGVGLGQWRTSAEPLHRRSGANGEAQLGGQSGRYKYEPNDRPETDWLLRGDVCLPLVHLRRHHSGAHTFSPSCRLTVNTTRATTERRSLGFHRTAMVVETKHGETGGFKTDACQPPTSLRGGACVSTPARLRTRGVPVG
jgi:hypothetical protein